MPEPEQASLLLTAPHSSSTFCANGSISFESTCRIPAYAIFPQSPTSFPSASPKQTLLFLLQSLADVSRNPTFILEWVPFFVFMEYQNRDVLGNGKFYAPSTKNVNWKSLSHEWFLLSFYQQQQWCGGGLYVTTTYWTVLRSKWSTSSVRSSQYTQKGKTVLVFV